METDVGCVAFSRALRDSSFLISWLDQKLSVIDECSVVSFSAIDSLIDCALPRKKKQTMNLE
jgi:hypothetical protein